MGLEGVLLMWRAVADVGAHSDERRPARLRASLLQRGVDRGDVIAVCHRQRLPSVRVESPETIFGERQVGAACQGHRVVIVQADQLAEAQMARQRRCFAGDAFHQVAIARNDVGRVVDDVVAGAVVARRQLRLSDRHADRIAEALPKRPRRNLHTGRVPAFGMPRCPAAPLAELLDIVQRQIVPGEMQQAIEQHRSVSRREHEAIAIEPRGIPGVVLQKSRPERVGHRRGAQWHAGMSAIGLLYGVYRQKPHGVDAQLVEHPSSLDAMGGTVNYLLI